MGSTFGTALRVTTFGESHGPALGVIVDGLPSRLPVSLDAIQHDLDRRRPGASKLVSPRKEADRVEILSGVSDGGLTLGTPVALLVRNEDARSRDYAEMADAFRPSHADFAYDAKYGIRAVAGGGRASARETVARVAAAGLVRSWLRAEGIEVLAWVSAVGEVESRVDEASVSPAGVEASLVRCPDPRASERMIEEIERVRKDGDSIGGVVGAVARGVPAGLGEPVFDKLEADLAKAILSLPACKGFELGDGFSLARRRGSEANDLFVNEGGAIRTTTNRSGGIQGGISNGMPIRFRAAFKPTATIAKEQPTVTPTGEATTIRGRGRHDPCVLPRAVPLVEAMALLVLADHLLRQRRMRASPAVSN